MTFKIQLTLLLLFCSSFLYAQDRQVAIASAHPLATQAGVEIFQQGGNVFDVAVAVSSALAVVQPGGSGLGGGGYWLLRRISDNKSPERPFETMIDGREIAPLAATANMFIDQTGKFNPTLSNDGALAAAIPGLPAALVHLSTHYGKLTLAQCLAPAIRYARYGFKINNQHIKLLQSRLEVIKKYPASAKIFLSDDNALPEPSSLLLQPDLADTLVSLAKYGNDGFYQGDIAKKMLKSINSAGGIWTQQDLDNYRIIERSPVSGDYHGIQITSSAPSSSGGVVLLETLNILAGYDLSALSSLKRKHLIIEASRRAYHDRALFLGDPDFTDVPVRRLLNNDYAAGLRSSVNLSYAMPSFLLSGENKAQSEGNNTTHFSILDSQGNGVSATLSINAAFGSGFVADGTGILLNNEMDDFSSQTGVMNSYGLIGGKANAIAPGKRMLSSMTPTFVETSDKLAVLGTPGGSRIITMLLLAVLDFADNHLPQSWVSLPRFHHQFMPDVIEYEQGALTPEETKGLLDMGHVLKQTSYPYGDMQAVLLEKQSGKLSAVSDPRGEGFASVSHR